MKKICFGSHGQVLLITMLVIIAALTVGLTILSRSLVEKQTSTTSEQSGRAYAAAEAGVEEALGQKLSTLAEGSAVQKEFETGASYTYSVDGKQKTIFEPLRRIEQDDAVQVNLEGFTGANLVVCWASDDSADQKDKASVEISLVSGISPNYSIQKWGFNGNTTRSANGFSNASNCGLSGTTKTYSSGSGMISLAPGSNPHLLRIKPLYNGSYIAIGSLDGTLLPVQGYTIKSEGKVGDTTRTVEVQQSAYALPTIFDNVLFGGSE